MKHVSTHLRVTAALVAAALSVIALGCDALRVSKLYDRGVVVTAAPPASQVGRDILQRGGNAYDAAVAVGFALAVVHPEAGNIGGGGFAMMRDGRDQSVRSLDFREVAPRSAFETMYLDHQGEVIAGVSTYGALASGVPGTVAGLHEIWRKFGSLPWTELIAPAIALADSGFIVDDGLARSFDEYHDQLAGFPTTARQFLSGGVAPSAGDRLIQSDLAHSLTLIAAEERDGFYRGETAEKIQACMEQHHGLITMEDLAAYEPVWREPIHIAFDSLDIYSMPPPSSGGTCLGQILKLLEPFDFSRLNPSSVQYIHLFCEASRLAFADRSEHLGDPGFATIPAGLLDSAYLAKRRELIDPEQAHSSENVRPGDPAAIGSDQTTHYSICDGQGNMVAITYTLNTAFGSKLTVDGAGFLLNNEMDDFSIKPGHPNVYGLVGGEANKIEPRKRMLSSMSPTLVLMHGQPLMVLGSPGGSKIITTVAEAIIDFTRFDLTPEETVAQPRFHHQWLPDVIYLEQGGFDAAVTQGLTALGHTVRERAAYGDLQLVIVRPGGLMAGAFDPRGRGSVAGLGTGDE